MQNKLVVLHHELLYPAFLGAILFEFSRKIIGLEFDALSFFSALWFILYFSAAFLALSEAHEADSEIDNLPARKFGRWAFFANLVEIAIILAASLGTEVIESRGFHDHTHATPGRPITHQGGRFMPGSASLPLLSGPLGSSRL